MKHRFFVLLICLVTALGASAAQPLRVFIRAGVKTHGPGQHDHPSFLRDWTQLLNDRGMQADGAMDFPKAEQLAKTDVLVVFAADGMKITGTERTEFEKFLKRGGGLVVVHDGVVSGNENDWAKKVMGGSWVWANNKTRWFEGEVGMYILDENHPITKGLSNWDWKDEIYFNLDMEPDVHVLGTSFHTPFIIAPQLWTYEKTWEGGAKPYRCFVSLPGHEYESFKTDHYRTVLLRGISWAAGHENADEYCRPGELAGLRYPAGGPIAPEKAASKIQVHPEFNMKLVVSEPLVEKVMSLDWDNRGRLWVVETPEYPGGRNINKNDDPIFFDRALHPEAYKTPKAQRPGKDRVSILENPDKEGIYRSKKVFYEGLELATSLVFYKDGVIVAQAPDILWIRDTNGDGKADKVETLFTGFGTSDTHAVMSNFRWGMDGWVYGAVGYSAGNPATADGSRKFGRITAGIFRFKPDGSAIQQVASGGCNTWGMDFTWDNEIIYSTATCGEPICHVTMPEWVVARAALPGVRATTSIVEENKTYPAIPNSKRRSPYVQIDWVGAFTAAAGSCMYVGGAWPEKWNNAHFISEPTVNLVHEEFLTANGATYQGHKEEGRKELEFLNGSDLWFRPIHQRVGPDGALYVVDFYNQAAIHNDTRGPKHGANNAAVRPDRDHHFARIWRVQHNQAATLPKAALDPARPLDLVKTLQHPNGWARMTAHRLLTETTAASKDKAKTVKALRDVVTSNKSTEASKIHALYVLNNVGSLEEAMLVKTAMSGPATVRKNSLRIMAETENTTSSAKTAAARAGLGDADGRVRMNALIALQVLPLDAEAINAVVASWPGLHDKYLESAALGIAVRDPVAFVEAAFKSGDPGPLGPFVAAVARMTGARQDAVAAARLVILAASQPDSLNGMKQVLLESLGANLKSGGSLEWTPELQSALKSLANASSAGLAGAAIPLIAQWDRNGALSADLKPAITALLAKIQQSSVGEDERAQAAMNLVGVRRLDPNILPAVAKLLSSGNPPGLQRKVVDALGGVPESGAASVLIAAYPAAQPDLQTAIFAQLIKRGESSVALLDAVQSRKIDLATLGPMNLHRLRTHPDGAVSKRANALIDEIRGPEQKEKDKLIAQLSPAVTQAGNIENGKKLFTANCASCHIYKNEGRDLAPNLTGMGVHGPLELLVHVVDPNRVVEPNFFAWSIETKDNTTFDGIITRENRTAVTLRNANGDYEIRQDNIVSRRNTGMSLMPNGFEALGGEGLRDLFAYICADDAKFRVINLAAAFTANSTRGIYNTVEAVNETLMFSKFGLIRAGEVPFEVVNPNKSQNGNNLVVLKGGPQNAVSRTMPNTVQFKVGFAAAKIHFLGGVGGWAYPCCGDAKHEGAEVVKATVKYADGQTQSFVFKNAVEFADYNGRNDVPGSVEVPNVIRNGQVRWFSRPVNPAAVIESITLESPGNAVAPTLVAVTAELAH